MSSKCPPWATTVTQTETATAQTDGCNNSRMVLMQSTENTLDCDHRAPTSAKASKFNQKTGRFGIRIYICRLIRIRGSGCLPNRSQNLVDSLSCRRQSFRRMSWKSAGDCRRHANPVFRNGEGSGKVIWNPYPGPDQHQKLIRSSD